MRKSEVMCKPEVAGNLAVGIPGVLLNRLYFIELPVTDSSCNRLRL
jgi:hypothetical protein